MEGQLGVKKWPDSFSLPNPTTVVMASLCGNRASTECHEAEEAAGDEEEEQRDLLRRRKVQLCV